jgi:hypothetical protein
VSSARVAPRGLNFIFDSSPRSFRYFDFVNRCSLCGPDCGFMSGSGRRLSQPLLMIIPEQFIPSLLPVNILAFTFPYDSSLASLPSLPSLPYLPSLTFRRRLLGEPFIAPFSDGKNPSIHQRLSPPNNLLCYQYVSIIGRNISSVRTL